MDVYLGAVPETEIAAWRVQLNHGTGDRQPHGWRNSMVDGSVHLAGTESRRYAKKHR